MLEPNDYDDLGVLARTLNAFEQHWTAVPSRSSGASPATTSFELVDRLAAHEPAPRLAA